MNLSKYTKKRNPSRANLAQEQIIQERRRLVKYYQLRGYKPYEIKLIFQEADRQKEAHDTRPYLNPETDKVWSLDTFYSDMKWIANDLAAQETMLDAQKCKAMLFARVEEVSRTAWQDKALDSEKRLNLILKSISEQKSIMGLNQPQGKITREDILHVYKEFARLIYERLPRDVANNAMACLEAAITGRDLNLLISEADKFEFAKAEEVAFEDV